MSTHLRQLCQYIQQRQKQAFVGNHMPAMQVAPAVNHSPQPTPSSPSPSSPSPAAPARPSRFSPPAPPASLRQQAGTSWFQRLGHRTLGSVNAAIGLATQGLGGAVREAGRYTDWMGLTRNGKAFGYGLQQYGRDLKDSGIITSRAGMYGVDPDSYAAYVAANMPKDDLQRMIQKQRAGGSPLVGPRSLRSQQLGDVGEVAKGMGAWPAAVTYGAQGVANATIEALPYVAANPGGLMVKGLSKAAPWVAPATRLLPAPVRAAGVAVANPLKQVATGVDNALSSAGTIPTYQAFQNMMMASGDEAPEQMVNPEAADDRAGRLNVFNESVSQWPDEVSTAFSEHPAMPQIHALLQTDPEQAIALGEQALTEIESKLSGTPEGQAEMAAIAETGDLTEQGRDTAINNLAQDWSIEQAMQAYSQMDPLSKLGLWAGGSVAVLGLLNALLGEGGIGSLLASLLGAGMAGYSAYHGGMLGGEPAAARPPAESAAGSAGAGAAAGAGGEAAPPAGTSPRIDMSQIGPAFQLLDTLPEEEGNKIIESVLRQQLAADPDLKKNLDMALMANMIPFAEWGTGSLKNNLGISDQQAKRILDVYARLEP